MKQLRAVGDDRDVWPHVTVEAAIAHAQKTPPTIGLTMLIMDIFGVDRRPALATIDRPTLVIGSAESSLAEAQKKMADAIAGAELLLLNGVGHAVFVDEPEIFAQALERLLSRPIATGNGSARCHPQPVRRRHIDTSCTLPELKDTVDTATEAYETFRFNEDTIDLL